MWTNVTHAPTRWCQECHWPIEPGANRALCLVHEAMLASLQTEHWRRLHQSYTEEEERLRNAVRRLKRNE